MFKARDVAFFAIAALVCGLCVGYVIGDQRIFTPAKDQLLLFKGKLSEVYYSSGKFAEEENKDIAKAKERYELALAKNPYHEEAREALNKLLQKYGGNPGGH